jgi:hypothetical protein
MDFTVKHAETITENDELYKFTKEAFIDCFKKKFVTEIDLLEYKQKVLYAVSKNNEILGILTYDIIKDMCWIYFCYTHYKARKRNVGSVLLKFLHKLMEKEKDVEKIMYSTEWHNRRMIRISRYHLPFKPAKIIYSWDIERT